MDNLLKDIREAERLGYGVHYGHYKADYPHTADHSVNLEPEPVLRKCAECGQEFEPARQNQRYCCEECKVRMNQRTGYQKRIELSMPLGPTACPVCGKTFDREKKSQIYCSRSCAATANNLNRAKKRANK